MWRTSATLAPNMLNPSVGPAHQGRPHLHEGTGDEGTCFNLPRQRLSGLFYSLVLRSDYVNIDTVQLSSILETDEFLGLNYFLSHTAFVICHKSESLETLLGVLWYL